MNKLTVLKKTSTHISKNKIINDEDKDYINNKSIVSKKNISKKKIYFLL